MDYRTNKLFWSRGDFTEKSLAIGAERALKYGQLSQPLVYCLWFYHRKLLKRIPETCAMLQQLGMLYVIPQTGMYVFVLVSLSKIKGVNE